MKNILFITLAMVCLINLLVDEKGYAYSCPPQIDNLLDCYVFTQTSLPSYPSSYIKTGETNSPGIRKLSYQLISQQWPYHNNPPVDPSIWQHNINIYIPDDPKTDTAFLYIGAEDIHSAENFIFSSIDKNEVLNDDDFSKIAIKSQMVVVALSDIPNQPITFYPFPFKYSEDLLVAHSWKLFLDDPQTNEFLPVHLAMVLATIKTMDLAQGEMNKLNLNINSFILSGASKRGWTAWLTNIADNRVTAFIPIVFDLLNSEENIKRISMAYAGNWPIAFLPYYVEYITPYLGTEKFKELMKIQDPLVYLQTKKAKRLEVEKYMVNASGDDFFLPDNSLTYLKKLPGEQNTLRILPNSSHRVDPQRVLEGSIIPFLIRYKTAKNLPVISWELKDNLINNKEHQLYIAFNEKPKSIIAWLALNPTDRDFRYACGIRYLGNPIEIPEGNKLIYSILEPEQGWSALFIELQFEDGLITTTPDFIFPQNVYPTVPPFIKSFECSTLPPI